MEYGNPRLLGELQGVPIVLEVKGSDNPFILPVINSGFMAGSKGEKHHGQDRSTPVSSLACGI